ncbi:nucleoside phosphorylase [Phototrophicus methaneseepsis]|uniref:Uridine phosphorylase n=1 Tax=Phototrophicus methaneseepsis TaxID=2710758 RepID=A0A7S8EC23_9CHLR|nr:nucleoside phosphorylase [Phototrophicus methaneseepsis]QPC83978.1 nucleoside phosphorylase [Phototrophicus methaneseepsis]
MNNAIHYPILEHDPTDDTALHPQVLLKPHDAMPEHVVLCFFQDVIRDVTQRFPYDVPHSLRHSIGSEIGPNPLHIIETEWGPLAILHPGVGAPLAAGFLEEAIALGGRKFMACGGAGVLNHTFDMGHVVVPQAAIRDEGTSYHYLPPSREVAMVPEVVQRIEETLQAHDVPYDVGKTWTTDAIYRETRQKINQRRDEGCLVVEMEAAAFFAVAQFRDVAFGQILYGGDDVSGDLWDNRGWQRAASVREKLFWLSAETVFKL